MTMRHSRNHSSRPSLEGQPHREPISTLIRATDFVGQALSLSNGAINLGREKLGNVTEKTAPCPGGLLAQICPPCRVTNSLQIYNPRPRPLRPAKAGSDAWKRRSKIRWVMSGLIPHPESETSRIMRFESSSNTRA